MEKSDEVQTLSTLPEYIGHVWGTWGTETSKYPEEEKIINDSRSSGERTGKSPNLASFRVLIYTDKLVDEY